MRAALLLVSAAFLPALARAQDDPACARFEEPLAYNACLASHGPKANIGAAPGGAPRQTDPEGEGPQGGVREVGPDRGRRARRRGGCTGPRTSSGATAAFIWSSGFDKLRDERGAQTRGMAWAPRSLPARWEGPARGAERSSGKAPPGYSLSGRAVSPTVCRNANAAARRPAVRILTAALPRPAPKHGL